VHQYQRRHGHVATSVQRKEVARVPFVGRYNVQSGMGTSVAIVIGQPWRQLRAAAVIYQRGCTNLNATRTESVESSDTPAARCMAL
jgi:hypothetical protein